MPLIARVINGKDPDALMGALRDVIDARPIGPVHMTSLGDNIVVVFDTAVGNQLTTGTNAAVSTAVVQLTATPTLGREIIIQAAPTNTANVAVGGISAQNLVLVAGAALALDWTDVSTVYAVAASGTQVINWIVRG
jgi:hypothetical protein